jgi:class 3 adenylate cyclase
LAELFGRLASFSRLILHDRRGTGLSGGGTFPDLETRARDLLSVLDSIRASRVALLGERTSGAALALFAATFPHRAASLTWFHPVATRRWSPEYPWGLTPEELRREAEWTRNVMGDPGAMREWLAGAAPWLAGDERLEALLARLDRHFMAPSTALEWIGVESQTDVTAILPLVHCPTVLIDHDDGSSDLAEARYIQGLIPGAALARISGERTGLVFSDLATVTERVRESVGSAPAPTPKSVLGCVMFTDIVESTDRLASIGDRAWADLLLQHHAIVRAAITRWGGRENDTAGDGFYATFDGPARAIRCALDIVDQVQALDLRVRAGIHAGEVESVDGKYAGLAVAVGARITAVAGPSEVLISRTVKDLTAGSGFDLEDRGMHELKGVPEAMHLYRVLA